MNFWPDLIGIAKYTGEMASWLAGRGHDVRVVAAPPYYPAWKLGRGFRGDRYEVGQWQGVRVYRCPLWVPVDPSSVKRLFHLLSFAASSFPVMLLQLFWRPSVVLVVQPTLFCAPSGLFVAWLGRSCSWLHIQDFELDAAIGMGFVRFGAMTRMAYAFERLLLGRFDRASTISSKMLARLKEKRDGEGVLFQNWIDTAAVFPLSGPSPMRRELGISDDVVVLLYSGSMGNKQGLEILIEAVRCVRSNVAVLLVICGDGPSKIRLKTLAGGMENVMFLPLQPVEKLNALLNMADIHLLPQLAEAADLVMPSKLAGMLASGRPIVATATEGTQIARVIVGCGLLVAPGDVNGLSESIAELADRSDLRRKMGETARRYALEHLDKNTVLANFERELIDSAQR